MSAVKNFSELSKLPAEALVVFGGTFDPFHKGHLSIVRRLGEKFSRILVAPTSKNPWKASSPTALKHRVQICRLILKDEDLPDIVVEEYSYVYAKELVQELRKRGENSIYWAVAEDISDSVKDWAEWDKLDITVVVLPITVSEDATAIRKGCSGLHPAAIEYAKAHSLYPT